MRNQIDLKAAVDALTRPRILHTTQPDPANHGQLKITSVQHPALIDLLEQGTGTSRGSGTGGGGAPGPIDAGALETWAQIRDQVRHWLRLLAVTWSDDLKADLRTWHEHHQRAVAGGRVRAEHLDDIERLVDAWRARIEAKYDPDERREWTDPCPAAIDHDARTGRTRRCGARRIKVDGVLQFAIALNVTRREAECRSCGQRWEGERGLMLLRYETNLAAQETATARADAARLLAEATRVVRAEEAVIRAEHRHEHREHRELAMTGPIDLP